jgi:predicted acylesterase/phospholipase RssA
MDASIIKHFVISGGGTFGLTVYGIIRELILNKCLDINHIETFHGTSAGAIVNLIFVLGYDTETLDRYFIKRPWDQVFTCNIDDCLSLFENCGTFNTDLFHKILDPLLHGVDLDPNVTLSQLYDKTQRDFYVYVTEINSFTTETVSYKTHPDWTVVDAVYASCAIPIIFKPLICGDKAYADGGFFLNYPISKCIELEGVEKDEILGIYKEFTKDELSQNVNEKSSLTEYMSVFMRNLLTRSNQGAFIECKHQICIKNTITSIDEVMLFTTSSEHRKNLIYNGADYANEFLSSHNFIKDENNENENENEKDEEND